MEYQDRQVRKLYIVNAVKTDLVWRQQQLLCNPDHGVVGIVHDPVVDFAIVLGFIEEYYWGLSTGWPHNEDPQSKRI